jgi:polyisoprenyl-teichoic acid--peptidoglycan teichoic acid transferase
MLMIVACLGTIYVYNSVFGVLNHISSAKDVRKDIRPTAVNSEPPPTLLQAPFNVLVIGVDLRDGGQPVDDVNSDTLIVVRVHPLEQWASLLSIPRDTLVAMPHPVCSGATKINAVYACGYNNPHIYGQDIDPEDSAAALAADTVEEYLGITIDYTAQVNFDGFQKLIDTIGGITIDVPRTILDAEYPSEDYGYMRLYIPAGLQRMDSKTALRYARTRHVDNDFGRAKRQQQVLQATLDTLKRQGTLERFESIPQLLQVLNQSVRTTLPLNDIDMLRGLAELAQSLHTGRIQHFVLMPGLSPDGSPNLLSDLSSALEWNPAYVRHIVEEFQSPPSAAVGRPEVIQK